MTKFWGADEPPPGLDEWLDDQVEKAIKEYIAEGSLMLDIEDVSIIVFRAAEPADEIAVKLPFAQLVDEMFENNTGCSGLLQLSPEDRIGFEKLRATLSETLKRLEEKMVTAENIPSWHMEK